MKKKKRKKRKKEDCWLIPVDDPFLRKECERIRRLIEKWSNPFGT